MNICMKNLDYSLSKTQVVMELAQVLHQAPHRPSPAYEPINFDLHLHRATNPVRNNKGIGNLTLPTIEIGQLFLNLHGSDRPRSPITIGGRITKFLLSNQPPNPVIVERINRLPFANPSTRGRRPQAAPAASPTVRVDVVQFGWICRDSAFSIECEEFFSEPGNITLEDNRREIRINLRLEGKQYLIVIAFSSINTISASTNMDNERCLVFDLNTPPSYEQEQGSVSHDPRTPLRLKLPYLPIPEHDRVAPFASLAIRVVCTSDKDLSDFQDFCKKAQLHKVDDYDYVVVRRNLFSLPVMSKMHARLQELDWAIAFQMESLLRSMAIDFQEADVLFPEIVQTVAQRGVHFTAAVIRSFKNKAKCLFFEGEVDFDIVQSFRQTVEDFIFQGDSFAPRPTDGSLYESFHVEVTPTTFHLEGPFPEQSNRVIRAYDVKYHTCFLRVSFLDEAHLHYRFDREVDGREFIQSRVRPLLYHGLNVAGRRFEFLAYSQSALKEHAVW
jgi:RNA-dependent RNA polymerase